MGGPSVQPPTHPLDQRHLSRRLRAASTSRPIGGDGFCGTAVGEHVISGEQRAIRSLQGVLEGLERRGQPVGAHGEVKQAFAETLLEAGSEGRLAVQSVEVLDGQEADQLVDAALA